MSARMTAVTPTQSRSAAGHNLEKAERKMPVARSGYERSWKCNTCKKLFSDAAGTVEISNPTAIKATGHNLEKVERKMPVAPKMDMKPTGDARLAKSLLQDEAGTVEIINPIEIKATGHDLKAVKRKEAGCTKDGYEAYWRCQTCKSFSQMKLGLWKSSIQ